MKKIAVFFSDPESMAYPFTSREYWQAYCELSDEITRLGGQLYITRTQDSYEGNGTFLQSWLINAGTLVESGPVSVSLVFDKGRFIPDQSITVFNNLHINSICTDKWSTYQLFSKYCPQTHLVLSQSESEQKLKLLSSRLKVIKPRDSGEGKDVFIGTNQEIVATKKPYPCLLQEFIDSSMGIPDITKGIHDLRIAVLNGEIVYSFVRTPPPNSLLANVALGGTLNVIDFDQIPSGALQLTQTIDKKLKHYGSRLYGIDMALSPSGYKIIELNSRLGLQQNSRHPVFIEFKKKLAEVLVEMVSG